MVPRADFADLAERSLPLRQPLRETALQRRPTPLHDQEVDIVDARPHSRPDNSRSTTDPSSSVMIQDYFSNLPAGRPVSSHRNRSPYARSHMRSKSSGSVLQAPTMTRAHSLPSVHAVSSAFETSVASTSSSGSWSPASRSPARVRSPFKQQQHQDDAYAPPPRSPSWYEGSTPGAGIESIQEDSELNITPRQPALHSPAALAGISFSRSGSLRRGQTSPLHSAANASAYFPTSENVSLSASNSPSPSLGPSKFNEAFPSGLSLHHHASNSSFSSLSTTPSSVRSRSPSISSLDTIEDVPDLEFQAMKDDQKRAAEREEDDEGPRRRSLDGPKGFGFGRNGGSNRERKRWSICGGERRAELDLDTIWED